MWLAEIQGRSRARWSVGPRLLSCCNLDALPAPPFSLLAAMSHTDTLKVFEKLQPGDRVELRHQIKVGFRTWETTTTGTVEFAERRRHSLHFNRNFDDKVYSDMIVLRLDSGELTTVTLDEFSQLKKVNPAGA